MYKYLFIFGLLLPAGLIAQVADSSLRRVPMQGAINFRDLGGYATTDGHHVRWGSIYRSADISKLTSADLDTLKARNIVYDVDLRGVAESAQAPDKLNPGTDYILCPAGSDSVNTMFRRLAGMTSGGDSLMKSFYSNTTYLSARYKPFFGKLLVLPQGDALVFHCTAGKDRTGIAAALLLYALGVPYATIRQDYEATNYYRAADNARSQQAITSMHISESVARALMSADGAYLDATFAAIRAQYGSVDRYLTEQLGLDKEKLTILKAKYLE
ncbi:tyrosine-protein phosphatase [Puia dinghuensis]|uniref:Protein-tyrosine-phosphatase n=1 Tax=Puia dinghuensis TaxID=1792502 RepID=A0A8J2UEP1_9BACT|nr:tyrosine-protein phosphatase [Puia dinghuensis]GGB07238.1 protein-tyrosine-phosphatase [Puia dinghuensis]